MIKFTNYGEYAELDLFGDIGENWFGDGNSFINFNEELKKYENVDLTINLDSCGGNVFDGNAIANAIKLRKKKTTCNIYSLSASIATQIMLACDEVNAFENSLIMIHEASGGAFGNKHELNKTAELLDKIDNILSEAYCKKTGMSKEEALNAMKNETWYSGVEAKEIGLIDNLLEANEMVAKAEFTDISNKFKNAPEILLKDKLAEEENKAKELEIKNKEIEIELALIDEVLFLCD